MLDTSFSSKITDHTPLRKNYSFHPQVANFASDLYEKSPLVNEAPSRLVPQPVSTGLQQFMNFFQDCIDFERMVEIDKQELVLQPDYNVYTIFHDFSGGARHLSMTGLAFYLERKYQLSFTV